MAERIKFNGDMLKFMSIFTNITHVTLKDCIESEQKFIFIVDKGQLGKAIGKGASNIKKLEAKFNKKVNIVEYNNDPIIFLSNLIYPNKAKEINVEDNTYTITPADSYTRGKLIGRNAINLREYESIMKRYFNVKEIRVI